MAAAHVRSASSDYNDSNTATATFSGTASAGGLIVVGIIVTDGVSALGTSITDSVGNTYAPIGASELIVGNLRSRLFYAKNITGGTNIAVTCVNTGTGYGVIIAHEVSGLDTSAPLDKNTQNYQAAAGTGANAVTSTAATTTTAGQYVFGISLNIAGGTLAAGTGFTSGALNVNASGLTGTSEYQIQAGAGSIAATFTASVADQTNTMMATFKAAGGGGETITMDKWSNHSAELISKRPWGVVASGTLGIKN